MSVKKICIITTKVILMQNMYTGIQRRTYINKGEEICDSQLIVILVSEENYEESSQKCTHYASNGI